MATARAPRVLGEGEGYLSSVLTTKGGEDVISIPTKWDNSPFYEHQLKKNVVNMQGQETYKFAVTSMVRDVHQVMEKAGITGDQVKAVIPHQGKLPHYQRGPAAPAGDCPGEVPHQHRPLWQHLFRQ